MPSLVSFEGNQMPRAEVCRRRMRDAIAFAHDSRPPVVRQLPGNHPECAPASVKWPVARISGTLVPTERATKTISPRDYGPSERERRLLLLWPTMSQMGHQRRFRRAPATSALPPISDMLPSRSKRRLGPITAIRFGERSATPRNRANERQLRAVHAACPGDLPRLGYPHSRTTSRR